MAQIASRLAMPSLVSIMAMTMISSLALADVVGAAVVHGAHGPGRAHADGRIAAGGHRLRGFLGGVDQRHDDAHSAEVQRLHDGRRLVPGDPHDRHRVGLRDRLQHGQDVVHFGGAVLQVDAQGIEALTRHDLGGEAVGHRQPAQGRALTGMPHLLDLVRSHGRTSRCSLSSRTDHVRSNANVQADANPDHRGVILARASCAGDLGPGKAPSMLIAS